MIHDKISNINNYPELSKFASGIANAVKNIEKLKNGANNLDGTDFMANRFAIKCGASKPFYESHMIYADVHFLIKGKEKLKYLEKDLEDKIYEDSKEARISYDDYDDFKSVELKEGEFCVFFPGEPHSTGNISDINDTDVEKVVFKLKMA